MKKLIKVVPLHVYLNPILYCLCVINIAQFKYEKFSK